MIGYLDRRRLSRRRSASRGRGAGAAILDAPLGHYAAEGLTTCAVDYEGFNAEAAVFWPRWFTSVAYSLLRVPETLGS
jgi:hypothetical protein